MVEDIYQRRRKSSLVFPYEPYTERGSFIKFIEESGIADIYFNLYSTLYNNNQRPEDAEMWIYDYFRSFSPSRKEELEESMEAQIQELLGLETEIQNYVYGKDDEPISPESVRPLSPEASIFGSFIGESQSAQKISSTVPQETKTDPKIPIVSEINSKQSNLLKSEMKIENTGGELKEKPYESKTLLLIKEPTPTSILDREFIEQGNDPRWLFCPSPMFRPGPLEEIEKSPQKQEMDEFEPLDQPPEDPNAMELEEDMKALASPIDPERLKYLYEKYEIGYGASQMSLKPSQISIKKPRYQSKSTETTPMQSQVSIPTYLAPEIFRSPLLNPSEETATEEDYEEYNGEDNPESAALTPSTVRNNIVLPDDPDFLERKIPSNYWTLDFSLKKVTRTNPDFEFNDRDKEFLKERILGKPYKIRPMDENSWLPERELFIPEIVKQVQLETPQYKASGDYDSDNEQESEESIVLPLERKEEFINIHRDGGKGDINGDTTLTTTTASSKPRRMSLAEYEWITKRHGVQYLRNLVKRTDIYHTGIGDENDGSLVGGEEDYDPCLD